MDKQTKTELSLLQAALATQTDKELDVDFINEKLAKLNLFNLPNKQKYKGTSRVVKNANIESQNLKRFRSKSKK